MTEGTVEFNENEVTIIVDGQNAQSQLKDLLNKFGIDDPTHIRFEARRSDNVEPSTATESNTKYIDNIANDTGEIELAGNDWSMGKDGESYLCPVVECDFKDTVSGVVANHLRQHKVEAGLISTNDYNQTNEGESSESSAQRRERDLQPVNQDTKLYGGLELLRKHAPSESKKKTARVIAKNADVDKNTLSQRFSDLYWKKLAEREDVGEGKRAFAYYLSDYGKGNLSDGQ